MKTLNRILALDAFRPDIAISRDEASRFLPWIIALMVYLAALTLAGSFTLHQSISAQHAAQVESFSVHLPHMNERGQETTDKVLNILRAAPGVKEANVVSTARIREMVEPWFGKGDALDNLPLPVIIEAKLDGSITMDYAGLKAAIQPVVPGVEIDDHKAWLTQFSHLVHTVQWVLLFIAAMIIGATAAVVIFACKTSLKIHRSTVALLHRLGAIDDYIASQFQHHAALLALKGAFVGSGLAAGTLVGLHLMAPHIDSPLFPSFALTGSHWLILLGLPIGMSVIALASARTSVLAALGKMP